MTDQHSEIMRAIGNLEGKVDGINKRLDAQNGRVGKSEERILVLEKESAAEKARVGIVSAIGGGAATLLFKWVLRI